MLACKLFEVRDKGTFIPVLAVKFRPSGEVERYLLGRAGYGPLPQQQQHYVYVAKITGAGSYGTTDPHGWPAGLAATMLGAHKYIAEKFDDLDTGAVIDVEYLSGKTVGPKTSERLVEYPYGLPPTSKTTYALKLENGKYLAGIAPNVSNKLEGPIITTSDTPESATQFYSATEAGLFGVANEIDVFNIVPVKAAGG